MLLDRLESGFLLFETPQGMVRAELSLRQRMRLLWTFRHFRQLSIPLLNERERALVNALFQHNAGLALPADIGSPVIGVIEDFVPPLPIEAHIDVPGEHPSEALPVLDPIVQKRKEPTAGAKTRNLSTQGWTRFTGVKAALQKLVRRPLPMFNLTNASLTATVALLSIGIILMAARRGVRATPASQAQYPASNHSSVVKVNVQCEPLFGANSAAIADSREVLSTPVVVVMSTGEQKAILSAEVAPVIRVHNRASTSGGASHRELKVRRTSSTPNSAVGGQESGIQATRPPLRFVYPAYVNVRGKVSLTARVEADGTVSSVKVVSGNRLLSASAVRAVRKWLYRPYVKDGQAVVTETNIVVSFFAEDAISMTYPSSLPSMQ